MTDVLATVRAALSSAATAPVDVLFLGDSITEGAVATSGSQRWVELLRDKLRARFPSGATGGEGYVPGYYEVTSLPDRFTNTGTVTASGTVGGLGHRTLAMTVGATSTVTFYGTGVDVFYSKGPALGTFSWSIDGGAATNVPATQPANAAGLRVQVRGLAPGNHTLTVTAVAGATWLEGVMVYNSDETKGVRVWEAGHSGYTAYLQEFEAALAPWYGVIDSVQPKCVVVMLGINDYRIQSNANNTPDVYRDKLVSMVNKIKARCVVPPSVIFIEPHEPAAAVAPNDPPPYWQDYRNALEAAAATVGAHVLDGGAMLGSFAAPGNPYDSGDGVHPNTAGMLAYAEGVYTAITGDGALLASTVAYLGDSEWTADEIEAAFLAEQGAQSRVCRVPRLADGTLDEGSYPADLAEALFRRVAHNLALRRLPLGVSANISEAGVATNRVGGTDAEVRRLEAPWRSVRVG